MSGNTVVQFVVFSNTRAAWRIEWNGYYQCDILVNEDPIEVFDIMMGCDRAWDRAKKWKLVESFHGTHADEKAQVALLLLHSYYGNEERKFESKDEILEGFKSFFKGSLGNKECEAQSL